MNTQKLTMTSVLLLLSIIWAVVGVTMQFVGYPFINIWWHLGPLAFFVHSGMIHGVMTGVLQNEGRTMVYEVVSERLENTMLALDADIQEAYETITYTDASKETMN